MLTSHPYENMKHYKYRLNMFQVCFFNMRPNKHLLSFLKKFRLLLTSFSVQLHHYHRCILFALFIFLNNSFWWLQPLTHWPRGLALSQKALWATGTSRKQKLTNNIHNYKIIIWPHSFFSCVSKHTYICMCGSVKVC